MARRMWYNTQKMPIYFWLYHHRDMIPISKLKCKVKWMKHIDRNGLFTMSWCGGVSPFGGKLILRNKWRCLTHKCGIHKNVCALKRFSVVILSIWYKYRLSIHSSVHHCHVSMNYYYLCICSVEYFKNESIQYVILAFTMFKAN